MTIGEVISLAATLCALGISLTALVTARRKDTKADGAQSGTVLTEIGYIKAQMDRLNEALKELNARDRDYLERLTAVEASAKQAHKRLDKMEA